MELFYGGNLKVNIKNSGILPENTASKILKNVLNGIKCMHSQNIMHRDIKPENILFRSKIVSHETQEVVLADFGLATFNNVERYIFPKCGTPGFVAPEIATINKSTDHYDLKCDMYSVGVTLYYILTGCMPYSGKHELIKENRECIWDFQKSGIFNNLTLEGIFIFYFKKFSKFKAKDLISNLVCLVEKRLNIDQTLNHQFFKIYEETEPDNLDEAFIEDSESTRVGYTMISSKMEIFNAYNNFQYFIFNVIII